MVAPQDLDVHQSVRVLELQNSDLWLRPTDLSWQFPILMTIREESFKKHRSRSSEILKAKEDKIEEAKQQKIKRSDDEWNYADWQQPMTWTSSSWRQLSSDETREGPDWQPSADWGSSDPKRERSEWRSSGSWQSLFARQ